ncbi:Predicted choloylglycine hydrolase [Poseidonocella pacifica]|uniref:Predicted choloylglycine hydrolase n=1 Tax=Poseidonocella pacifica TaxID=871651 RepID=A0A1I0VXG7_9RHOB|nr:C45 family peptidase [Poseidonocella pacifica]SFA80583.1 Predicted choloylglycine hydrolase [Poseidonocella pacifica]
MSTFSLEFDAIAEARPGPKWAARWQRSWPAYEAWFVARGGDAGPDAATCRAALHRYMPELLPVYDALVDLAGGSDRARRFLSTWCPPTYLGGCSLAAKSKDGEVRLVRNYDLSPDLNEGLLLRTEWTGRPVMGMVEFLWGLSDGVNEAGLAIALAYGGRTETGPGFGIATILRYVLETCDTVPQALEALSRVPSHMAYNLVVADRAGRTASVEMTPGGGMRQRKRAIATNHQSGKSKADRPAFTRSHERRDHLKALDVFPSDLSEAFLKAPLIQDRYGEGFGTLFTAEYDPVRGAMSLIWRDGRWDQTFENFKEQSKLVSYGNTPGQTVGAAQVDWDWTQAASIDWVAIGMDFAAGKGRPFSEYFSAGDAAPRSANDHSDNDDACHHAVKTPDCTRAKRAA